MALLLYVNHERRFVHPRLVSVITVARPLEPNIDSLLVGLRGAATATVLCMSPSDHSIADFDCC